jgi:hypothetical protein
VVKIDFIEAHYSIRSPARTLDPGFLYMELVLAHRPMLAKDVDACVEVIATHPVIGPRYGRAIEHLRTAWLRLLGLEAMRTKVFEAQQHGRATICFVGISLCVDDAFIRHLKTPPIPWVGPEIVEWIMRGDPPVLTDRQLREDNSRCGLNLLVWEGCIRSGFETHKEIYREIVQAFLYEHRGFLWKEIISAQMESIERLQWTLSTGGLWWHPAESRYVDATAEDQAKIFAEPHIVGMTRALELERPASWVGDLFNYRPPRCGFSRSEQRLILSALGGATDEELATALHVSLPTVKKTWLSIYGRAAVLSPAIVDHFPSESPISRGKEKRRHLLAYLREHTEELRPYSLKLLP